MKKNYSLALFALALVFLGTLQAFAVDYTISFTGSGKSATVGSVEAQNITKGTSVTVPGGDVLVLNVTNTALNPLTAVNDGMRISSSVAGSSTVSFYAKQAGNARISVYSMDGRKIAGYTQNLQKGTNSFQVSVPTGAYLISAQGAGYALSGKMISISSSNRRPEISFMGVQEKNTVSPLKSAEASASLAYTPGDIMLYKGISGNYATIVTDVPTDDKTVNFNFIECKDASGNYYATVKIGNQVWMAENLATTKYRTGADITNITVDADWANTAALSTPAWCYANNDAATNGKVGKLYNWWAANDARNITPLGWHLPSIAEYDTLGTFLGGLDIASAKMKDPAVDSWVAGSDPPATNSSGFSAKANGKRSPSGVFNDGNYCYLWTSTDFSATNGNAAYMTGDADVLNLNASYNPGKRGGLSLRCVLDDQIVRSLSFYAAWQGGTDQWNFSYDPTSNQITEFVNYWDGGLDKDVTFDYSVPGKLTLAKDGTSGWAEYDINANGNITKNYSSGDLYEYDANGFLVKTFETWSGSAVLHNLLTITDGNVTKITTYDDDGVTVKKVREYTYTTTDNTAGIPQAHINDVEWKPINNFYGKPSAKLVDYFEQWDPRVNPIVKTKFPFVYTFDTRNRVSKAVKTLADATTEEWSYTYGD